MTALDSVAYLTRQSFIEDEIGQCVEGEETLLEVFVTETSITRAEFFGAGQNGFKPDLVLKMPKINYSGETEIVYNQKRYSIYRTFSGEDSDEIELYVRSKVGVINE